ncbi:MAG: HPF/RaiA family ribosome-associated protein [Actinomycetota bacterium]
MRIRVSSPGNRLTDRDKDAIEQDLAKIERRLNDFKEEVTVEVRIEGNRSTPTHKVTLELRYGRNHLIAKADQADVGQAIREAREEILRQINDRSRRGHSSFTKGR